MFAVANLPVNHIATAASARLSAGQFARCFPPQNGWAGQPFDRAVADAMQRQIDDLACIGYRLANG